MQGRIKYNRSKQPEALIKSYIEVEFKNWKTLIRVQLRVRKPAPLPAIKGTDAESRRRSDHHGGSRETIDSSQASRMAPERAREKRGIAGIIGGETRRDASAW